MCITWNRTGTYIVAAARVWTWSERTADPSTPPTSGTPPTHSGLHLTTLRLGL